MISFITHKNLSDFIIRWEKLPTEEPREAELLLI